MHLFFYPIADSYWLVAAVAAAFLAIVVLVGPGRDRASLGRRLTLAAIRVGVIVLLVLGMLRPALVYTSIHKEKATLVILVDQSRSMLVRDGLNNQARWDSLLAALEDSVPALRDLGSEFEIKAYAFDAQTHTIEVKNGRLPLPDSPAGQETAIGAALDDVLNQENGKRLLGIVILTDGRQQAIAPRDTSPQEIAARMRHQGDPVFPVVFGQSRGLGGVRDVAMVDFPTPSSVFVKTEMAIHGQVKINGYVNKEIPVRLLIEESPGSGQMKEIDKKKVKADADGQLAPVDFTYVPETPGDYKITLEAVPQPDELVTTNNRLSSYVQVLKGGLHVLYIEGGLRVEEKFLQSSLDASRDIKVDYLRIDPRHVKETKPSDLIELLKPDKYDVYILGDVDSTAFTKEEMEQLKTAVDRGKGLIVLGGFHTFGPGGYDDSPLADVLPVVMDHLERQSLTGPLRDDVQLPGPLKMGPTPHNVQHFLLRLASGARANAEAWAKLPPLDGANRLTPKPQALILAEADGKEGEPLLITEDYGGGRVIAFAGDSTWRWVMRGFESEHKRFWRQIVLWLAHKDTMSEGGVWVRLDNTRFFPGNRVDFTAGAMSDQNQPVADANFKVEVVKPDKKSSPVVAIRTEDHAAGAFRETQQPGDYTIKVTATRQGQILGTAQARFNVSDQDLELDNPSADFDSMKALAKSSGGEVIEPERLPRWLADLMKKTDYLNVPQSTKAELWDNWQFFLAIVLALTAEWSLRKRWGLV